MTEYKTIAIVGLSRNPDKDSYIVASYLKHHGFSIIPINPFADKIIGEKSYRSLLDLPLKLKKTIEIIVIFRPSNQVLGIVKEAIKLKKTNPLLQVIWLQLNIINNHAAKLAENAGFKVIMNKCMRIEHLRLFGTTISSV